MDARRIGCKLTKPCTESVLQRRQGVKGWVRQSLLAPLFPNMLGRVELRTARRLGQQPNVLRDRQPLGYVPARTVEEHDDKVACKLLGDMGQEQAHHFRVGHGQDQGGQASQRGTHGGKHVDKLPYYLTGHGGPHWLGSPAPTRMVDPTKAAFILGHDQHRTDVLRGACLEDASYRAGEVFLKASCSTALLFGWRGLGTTLRHWCRLRTRYTVVFATGWPTACSRAGLT